MAKKTKGVVIGNGDFFAPAIYQGTSQVLAFSGSSAASTAVGADTKMVRLAASAACYVEIGAAPVATSASIYLPAGVVELWGITPGHKVAALQVSGAGNLSIVEADHI